MKTHKFNILIIMVAAFLMSFSYQTSAQKNGRGQGQGYNQKNSQKMACNIPELTEDQKKKIGELRTANMKEMLQSRNAMAEKKARLNTLRTAEKVDMNAINKTIDELGAIQTKMMKQRESHRQSVRNLLTDDQEVYFDSRKGRSNKGNKGRGHGMGYGKGKGCPRF